MLPFLRPKLSGPGLYHKCVKNVFSNKISVRNIKRVFSGIQPTGSPHLGNYFGAIRTWERLQESHDCIYSIVNLHSITLPQDPKILRNNTHLMAACLLACGIDPDKSILFVQNQVPQHAELSWILGCNVTMPRMAHFPQYKEKSAMLKEVPVGLFSYPILQSADILLYKANQVPVGEDQVLHINLASHIANTFNNRYKPIFVVPEPLLDLRSAKIKSLRQPDKKKMSKSDPDLKNRVELTDSPDIIFERIKKSVTDFVSAVTYDPENRPGVSNLILIHSLCSGLSVEEICEESKGLDTGQYKSVVSQAVIEHLRPIQARIQDYLSNLDYLESVLKKGSEKAKKVAVETLDEVNEAMGLSLKSLDTQNKDLNLVQSINT